MSSQIQRAAQFKSLHVKGNPIVLYNIWDPGSAQAVASVGAKAIASGSHGVANAFGYEDGEKIPLELALENARRIVFSVEVPVTMDIESGYATENEGLKDVISKVIKTGVIGINLEDQLLDQGKLRDVNEQCDRLSIIRKTADEHSIPLFINARSDIFKNASPDEHSPALLAEAISRADAYAQNGADGFFLPGIKDINLIRELCEQSPIAINIIWLPGMVTPNELAEAGVSRISYGPGPYLSMIEWLKDQAKIALNE